MEPLLTAREACGLLRVSPSTLYRLIREEGLPAIKPAQDLRFRPSDIEQWIETRRKVVPSA
jgi:excisionase family DNA binding protein